MTPVIVYPIRKNPNTHQDKLLKYSLRSLEQNGGELSQVYLIGKRRSWFSPFIKVVDVEAFSERHSKFLDVTIKLKTFCEMGIPFVLMNDDFILSQPTEITNINNKALPSVKDIINNHRSHTYQTLLTRTLVTVNKGEDMNAFVTHTPMLIDKPELMTTHTKETRSLSFRQEYAVHRNLPEDDRTTIINKDVKIKDSKTTLEWLGLMNNMEMLSLHPSVVDANLFKALDILFPDKSRYEI